MRTRAAVRATAAGWRDRDGTRMASPGPPVYPSTEKLLSRLISRLRE